MTDTIDKLALMRIENNKVLMVRSHGKDKFYHPGGKREPGETDLQALVREIKEELSVDIIPESVKLFRTYQAQADAKPAGVMVKMTCYSADYKGMLNPSSEIAEYDWLDSSAVDKISVIGKIIFSDLKKRKLIR